MVITPSCVIVHVGTVDLELSNEIFFKSGQKKGISSHAPRSRAMLLVIHSMVAFAILDPLLTIDDLEEKIVVSLREMNNVKMSKIQQAFFLFDQRSNQTGPSFWSKHICDREVDHVNMELGHLSTILDITSCNVQDGNLREM